MFQCFCGSYVKIKSEKEVYEHDDITIVSSDLPEENCFDEQDEEVVTKQ